MKSNAELPLLTSFSQGVSHTIPH